MNHFETKPICDEVKTWKEKKEKIKNEELVEPNVGGVLTYKGNRGNQKLEEANDLESINYSVNALLRINKKEKIFFLRI